LKTVPSGTRAGTLSLSFRDTGMLHVASLLVYIIIYNHDLSATRKVSTCIRFPSFSDLGESCKQFRAANHGIRVPNRMLDYKYYIYICIIYIYYVLLSN